MFVVKDYNISSLYPDAWITRLSQGYLNFIEHVCTFWIDNRLNEEQIKYLHTVLDQQEMMAIITNWIFPQHLFIENFQNSSRQRTQASVKRHLAEIQWLFTF